MAKGLLHLSDGRFRVVSPESAVRYWLVLHGKVEPTPEEEAKVMHIKHVSIPPSFRPPEYQSAITNSYRKEPLQLDIDPLQDENMREVPVQPSGKDLASGQ